jgi:histidinol-phosphatase
VGSYDDDLRFAHVLADAADDITTKRFKALDLRVETKPDLTPVSPPRTRSATSCAGRGRVTP